MDGAWAIFMYNLDNVKLLVSWPCHIRLDSCRNDFNALNND